MLKDLDHPYSEGEAVYDVTFENVQAGLRTDYLFRLANHRGGIVLGTGDLSELALGWCTYGVGDQMSHYGVNAGVPKTLIQHLIRWVIASDSSTTRSASGVLDGDPRPRRSPRSSCPPARARARRAPRRPSAPTRCRTSRSSTCCATASRRAGSRSWPGTPGATRTTASGRPASRRVPEASYDLARDPALARGLPAALLRVQQFKRSAMPNGPKVVAGGSLAARRVARPVGRQRRGVARGAAPQRPRGVNPLYSRVIDAP